MHGAKKNYYTAFGLNISSEIVLPELLNGNNKVDVEVITGKVPVQLSNPLKTGVRFQASEKEFLLNVDNVADYYITDGDKITVNIHKNADEASVRLFLLGSAFGALLIQQDMFALHGSSINFNGHVILFTGISGAGKSTLAAAFYKKGYPILDDDISVIHINNKKPFIVPGYPQMKLWADVIKNFDDNPENYDKVRNNLEKHAIEIKAKFKNEILPLKTIFVLTAKNTDGFEVEKISGIEKFNILRKNTYRFHFIDGLAKQKEHFKTIDNIARTTDLFRVKRPRKGFHIEELTQLIIEKINEVQI